jgi:alkyl hydroperoxide reductase subunit AhpF
MANHSSASMREHTPHVNHNSKTNAIVNALKRRAQAVLNDKSIDPEGRAFVRYALEINDPWLSDLVRRADAGELVIGMIDFSQEPELFEDDLSEERIEELAEIICRAGTESMAALVALMATIECSWQPKVLANAVKHFALTRCAESKRC